MTTRIIEDEITEISSYFMDKYDEKINKFYSNFFSTPHECLQAAADLFLNKPYFFEALGEGEGAPYSQEPLYRTDKFDCVTYVDTVLSLYKSKNLEEFKNNILKIRYKNGTPSYFTRTDWFTDLDWIPHVQQLKWISDITPLFVDETGNPITKIATTYIDKQNWYAVKPLKIMHRIPPLPNDKESKALLEQLRSQGRQSKNSESKITYLPLTELFPNNEANSYLFGQIPSGSVIMIVRPDWQIKDNFPSFPHGYGTNLNVSHLGIMLRINNEVRFYNASTLHHQVEYEDLINYLKKYINHASIKGIHIEKII